MNKTLINREGGGGGYKQLCVYLANKLLVKLRSEHYLYFQPSTWLNYELKLSLFSAIYWLNYKLKLSLFSAIYWFNYELKLSLFSAICWLNYELKMNLSMI